MTAPRLGVLGLAAALAVACGCGSTGRSDPAAERRAFAQLTKSAAIADLDAARPGATARLEESAGWAVFSTIGAKVFLGETPGGFGVAHDTKSGTETYMRMSEPSFGAGLGSEQFRAVFVFRDAKTFREFVDKGWDFRIDDSGPDIEVLQLGDGGLLADPTLAGTRYWKDRELN